MVGITRKSYCSYLSFFDWHHGWDSFSIDKFYWTLWSLFGWWISIEWLGVIVICFLRRASCIESCRWIRWSRISCLLWISRIGQLSFQLSCRSKEFSWLCRRGWESCIRILSLALLGFRSDRNRSLGGSPPLLRRRNQISLNWAPIHSQFSIYQHRYPICTRCF